MKVYDVTVPLDERTPVFPGDPVFHYDRLSEADGQHAEIRHLHLCSHAGTHVDSESHLVAGGWRIDQIAPSVLVGTCAVRHLIGPTAIGPAQLEAFEWDGVDRVLFRTSNSALWRPRRALAERWAHLTGAGAAFLAERGVRLVGWDYVSIDAADADALPAHRALLGRGIVIVESLDLSAVPAGEDYLLCCAPLKLTGAEGAPARVLLIAGESGDTADVGS